MVYAGDNDVGASASVNVDSPALQAGEWLLLQVRVLSVPHTREGMQTGDQEESDEQRGSSLHTHKVQSRAVDEQANIIFLTAVRGGHHV